VHPPIATPAVKQDVPEFALQLSLRLQQLHPQALRRGDEAGLVLGSTSWASSTTR
jgi:hypothetical protein